MTKRKAIPARVMVSVAIRQANSTDHMLLLCPLCQVVLWDDEPRVLEHMTPRATLLAIGAPPDDIDNLRWVHAACAARKTNGTKATTAGSDKHNIRKGERLEVARLAKSQVEKKLSKERWRLKKKVSGEVVRVRTR